MRIPARSHLLAHGAAKEQEHQEAGLHAESEAHTNAASAGSHSRAPMCAACGSSGGCPHQGADLPQEDAEGGEFGVRAVNLVDGAQGLTDGGGVPLLP